ncbi:MAG: hypothetical protein O3A14_18930 [Cyanobacteria bacterium]|nr:hypothetical protein [Cyanobacteriota bacterium]
MTSHKLSTAISDLYAQVIDTKKITAADRQVLIEAIHSQNLGEDERQAIDRLLWSASRGRMQVVDG